MAITGGRYAKTVLGGIQIMTGIESSDMFDSILTNLGEVTMKSKTEYEEVMLYINKWRYDHQAPDSEVLSRLCGWLDAKIEAKSE